jgi:hypothetical protein
MRNRLPIPWIGEIIASASEILIDKTNPCQELLSPTPIRSIPERPQFRNV